MYRTSRADVALSSFSVFAFVGARNRLGRFYAPMVWYDTIHHTIPVIEKVRCDKRAADMPGALFKNSRNTTKDDKRCVKNNRITSCNKEEDPSVPYHTIPWTLDFYRYTRFVVRMWKLLIGCAYLLPRVFGASVRNSSYVLVFKTRSLPLSSFCMCVPIELLP